MHHHTITVQSNVYLISETLCGIRKHHIVWLPAAEAVTTKYLCCVFLGTVKEDYLTQPDTNTNTADI